MCKCGPVTLLFVLRSQVNDLPESLRDCVGDKTMLFKGIPVAMYECEGRMLADFFDECMRNTRVVAYINGEGVIRSDA